MAERSLLERLLDPGSPPGPKIREDRRAKIESIVRNLSRVLNSRHGSAPAQPDYGIPELSDILVAFPAAVGRMQKAIRATIEKYEPRLTGIQVIHVQDETSPMTLRFLILARLVEEDRPGASVSFDTAVESGGDVRVSV